MIFRVELKSETVVLDFDVLALASKTSPAVRDDLSATIAALSTPDVGNRAP